MKSTSRNVSACIALACIMLLAACGDSDATDDATDEANATTTETTEVTTEEVEENEESAAPTTATADEPRTPEQQAIDSFDVTMYQLGVRDLVGVSDCVLERLDSEGLSLVDNEAAGYSALLGCEPDVRGPLFGDQTALFGAEPWECASGELASYAAEIPLSESEAFFASSSLPDELITIVTSTCDIAEGDFRSMFG